MRFAQTIGRMAIVVVWSFLIMGFLFTPRIKQAFKPTPSKSITVYTWTDYIAPEMVAQFEKETGIQVYLSYFETNEELYAKIQYTKGEGYDLLIPSGYMIPFFIKDDLLKKIDTSKLDFWERLQSNLTDPYFDPGNKYSIPFCSDYWCIAYDKRFYTKRPKASWDIIFNNETGAPKVGMTNDARESVLLTAKYLFGTTFDLSNSQIKELSEFLRNQKPRVAAYTDLRADYLIASGTAQAAVSQTSFIIRAMWGNPQIGLLIPPKTFVLIDSLVIPKTSPKDDLVYQFINFLYRPDVIKYHWQAFAALPTTSDSFVKEALSPYGIFDLNWKNISFMRSNLSNETINKIWLNLKSY